MTETEYKPITQQFANFVREKRIALDLSLREFAELVFGDDKKFAHIHKIEQGRPITLKTMDDILKRLNCTIEITEL